MILGVFISLAVALGIEGTIDPANGRSPAVEEGVAPKTGSVDRPETTYVNTSFEAEEALRKARERGARADWPGAATAYQTLADKFGNQLLRSGDHRYVGVRRLVVAEMSKWPPEGIQAYEAVFGRIAEDQFQAAANSADVAKLVATADRYFMAAAGASALNLAAESAIERGEFAVAHQWYAELLAFHPERDSKGAEWRVKQALCLAWNGDARELNRLVQSSDSALTDRRVNWAGRRQTLQDFARAMLDELSNRDAVHKSRADRIAASPSTFCGGVDRRGDFQTTASPEARLWRASLSEGASASGGEGNDEIDTMDSAVHLRAVQSGRLLGAVPVFGDGLLFVADSGSVRAFDPMAPESAAWEYRVAGAPPRSAGWIGEDEPPEQFTVLYAQGRIFAPIASQDSQGDAGDNENVRQIAELICLDGRTGREIWKRELNSLGSRFEEVTLDGAPILHNDRLFATARRRKGFGFEACLLICFDPRDGRLLWSTHVGEAATGSYGYTHPTRTYPAASGDRIFVHSNLGTVAAVSASTGEVDWLVTYPSRFSDQAEIVWPTRFGQPIRAWQYQPTMICNDTIVCAPMDLEELLILSQNDGTIVRRVRMDRLFNPESILGIRGNQLFTAGGQVVCFDLSAGEIVWQRPLAEGRLFGRGAVTSNGVFVPTSTALLRYPLDGGAAARCPWRIEEAGNLLPLSDQIVATGADYVTGLVAKDDALARLERLARERPKDPFAMLALAELAFSQGEDERGLTASRGAIERIGDLDELEDAGNRRRLFDRFLRFAESVADEAAPNAAGRARLATAGTLIDLAGRCAPNPAATVACRFTAAKNDLLRGDAPAAIASYQSLLESADLSTLRVRLKRKWAPTPEEGKGEGDLVDAEVTVGIVAQDWIERLLARHGQKVYQSVEARAAAELNHIRGAADADALRDMALKFPNSGASGIALALAGRRASRAGNVDLAIRCYRLALTRPALSDRARVIREFAETLAATGRTEEAALWLNRGSRDYPELRFGGEAGTHSFSELRAMLDIGANSAEVNAAVVGWPVKLAYQRVSKDRASILSVYESRTAEAPLDLVLAHTGGRLEARNPASGRAIWPKAVACDNLPILLASDGDRLYLAGANRIFALARTSGVTAWQFGEESRDPDSDPEETESWTDHAVTATSIFSASDRGDIICLSRDDGRLNWRRPVEGGTASHIAADRRFVYCAKWRGRHNVIHIFDAKTGEPKGAIQCEDSRPIQSLEPAPGGELIVILSRCAMGLDPERCEILWSIGTPRHFLVSTFLPDVDGFLISAGDRRISKYDYHTGRRLWQTDPIGEDDRDSTWIGLLEGRVVAASHDTMKAFDSADGRLLWTAADPPGLRWQTPTLTSDSILMVAPIKNDAPASAPTPFPNDATERFEISRFSLLDGRTLPLTEAGPLVTEPLGSFGGFFVRNRAILMLDGGEVIGYVGSN